MEKMRHEYEKEPARGPAPGIVQRYDLFTELRVGSYSMTYLRLFCPGSDYMHPHGEHRHVIAVIAYNVVP